MPKDTSVRVKFRVDEMRQRSEPSFDAAGKETGSKELRTLMARAVRDADENAAIFDGAAIGSFEISNLLADAIPSLVHGTAFFIDITPIVPAKK
jgi:hypothetical protein